MSRDPDALLPLKPVAYQVLLALADGERHGYGIVQDIGQRTAARMRLEPGNLYRTLKWMLGKELIEESDRRPAPDLDDERRRYYRVTRFGWRVGVAETARLEALVVEAKSKRWPPAASRSLGH
jgi:DNA-binding PadR family transcriptional regulator